MDGADRFGRGGLGKREIFRYHWAIGTGLRTRTIRIPGQPTGMVINGNGNRDPVFDRFARREEVDLIGIAERLSPFQAGMGGQIERSAEEFGEWTASHCTELN